MPSAFLKHSDVIFYHQLDDNTEYTKNRPWNETSTIGEFVNSPITSGFQCTPTGTLIRLQEEIGDYPTITGVSGFTTAFWVSGFLIDDAYYKFFEIGLIDSLIPSQTFDHALRLFRLNGSDISMGISISGEINYKSWTPSPTFRTGWDFFVLDGRYETSGWRHRASINGSGWNDLGVDTNTVILTSSSISTTIWGGKENINTSLAIDEVILWGGNNLFTSQELSNLYELSNTYNDTMDQYQSTFPLTRSIDFIINGKVPIPVVSCPILDPTASIQITDELIGVYQSRIDAVINQLGKSVMLEFTPIKEDCPNCSFDMIRGRSRNIYTPGGPRPFDRGRKCPYCKGKGFLETVVQKCIRCLIRWNAKDASDYGISVSRGKNIVRFKTYLYNFDDIVRAKYAISNYAIQDMVKLRVGRIKDPIITGLREDRYCISFWETV